MEIRVSKTFIVLWDGSDEGYSPDEFADHVRLTAQGHSVTTGWSFGRGYGDPEPGDRIFLHKTGNDNGIIASGQILSDGVKIPSALVRTWENGALHHCGVGGADRSG